MVEGGRCRVRTSDLLLVRHPTAGTPVSDWHRHLYLSTKESPGRLAPLPGDPRTVMPEKPVRGAGIVHARTQTARTA
jgi:hypothetical protein